MQRHTPRPAPASLHEEHGAPRGGHRVRSQQEARPDRAGRCGAAAARGSLWRVSGPVAGGAVPRVRVPLERVEGEGSDNGSGERCRGGRRLRGHGDRHQGLRGNRGAAEEQGGAASRQRDC